MIYFIASTILNFDDRKLIKQNNFIDLFKSNLKDINNVLFITSYPDDDKITYNYASDFKNALISEDIKINNFYILNTKTMQNIKTYINEVNLIFLSGGHIKTENDFINKINLKKYIKDFDGVFISSSAGSMNSSDLVYNIPELENETKDLNFKKYLKGLGLTNVNIFPHFQYLRYQKVDNLSYLDDILYNEEKIKEVLCLDDGSFIYKDKDGNINLYGSSFLYKDKVLYSLLKDGEKIQINEINNKIKKS